MKLFLYLAGCSLLLLFSPSINSFFAHLRLDLARLAGMDPESQLILVCIKGFDFSTFLR